jgi:MFS family permease
MKNTTKIAFCGVLAALGVVLMFLTGVVPVATIAIPAIAGCFLIPIVAECGTKWGFGVFVITALLSFLLATDREAFLVYLLFFGYYPVLYAVLDRMKNRKLMYAVKLLIFNVACVIETWLTIYVLGIPFENIGLLGNFTAVVLLILANFVFIIYDYALRGLIAMYFAKFHRMIQKTFRIK